MNLNHSVVIFGWGIDKKGTKFWRVRNSYGTKWGMQGDFWVRRGENDFGIESETTAYDVMKCKPDNKTYICKEDLWADFETNGDQIVGQPHDLFS